MPSRGNSPPRQARQRMTRHLLPTLSPEVRYFLSFNGLDSFCRASLELRFLIRATDPLHVMASGYDRALSGKRSFRLSY